VNPRCTSRAERRAIDPALLATVLELALAGVSDEDGDAAVAIGVRTVGTEAFDLALQPLVSPDPVRALFGFVAPQDWGAFGVIATGTADGRPDPVHLGVLVGRSGELTVARRSPGRAVDPIDATAGCGGRVPDACRRALGLATPPPATDTAELWATLWLETLVASSLTSPRAIGWGEAARAHPCFEAVHQADPALAELAADHLVDLGQAARRAWSWARLLESCRAGQVPACGLDPDEAGWMDEGIFSREVLGRLPPWTDLLRDLTAVLTPDVVGEIERTLAAWGLVEGRGLRGLSAI
jgi:hypothetical protein